MAGLVVSIFIGRGSPGPTPELTMAGDPDIQYYLGVAYARGEGVDQDYTQAAKWLRLAAEQGHALAQLQLAAAYAQGKGVATDHT